MTPYRVPTGYGQAEFLEKRSRFIGHIWRVDTEDDALAQRKATRATHNAANHNVFAYIIQQSNVQRCNDDGEPQGAAGAPILQMLEREGISNVLCIVTRYFGGTLLGTGGLIRAYTQAARQALDSAGISLVCPQRRIRLVVPYAQHERLQKVATDLGALLEYAEFLDEVTLHFLVPEEKTSTFLSHMQDQTAGRASVTCGDIQEIAVPL